MRWLDGIIDSTDMSLSNLWEMVKEKQAWDHKELDTTEQLKTMRTSENQGLLLSIILAQLSQLFITKN